MHSPLRLSVTDAWHLLTSSLKTQNPTRLALLIRPNRTSDLTYASLLATAAETHQLPLTLITPQPTTSLLRRHIPSATLYQLPQNLPQHNSLRAAAHYAVANDIPNLILPHTTFDVAQQCLSSMFATPMLQGVEMLPPGLLTIAQPFTSVPEHVIDATSQHLAMHSEPLDTETQRITRLIGDQISLQSVLAHGKSKAAIWSDLNANSTALIRSAVLEASQWGYLVVRRSTLADMYHSSHGGRLIVMHALSRMIMHVSGSSTRLPPDDEHISRLSRDLLQFDASGKTLVPLPKGRTAAGMVVRPATGRFARRLQQQDRYIRRRPAIEVGSIHDDLMILTREPDHESAGLLSKRLRGNWASVALSDKPVYWDNRFVMVAAPVSFLDDPDASPIDPKATVLAALELPRETNDSDLIETSLYVRQIRRGDWERVTAATDRVRSFHIPFQCIRALPAIFQKSVGETSPGHLVASPHLGLSSRPDLFFTAVRVPRFRTLPTEIEPGFCIHSFRNERKRPGLSEEKPGIRHRRESLL